LNFAAILLSHFAFHIFVSHLYFRSLPVFRFGGLPISSVGSEQLLSEKVGCRWKQSERKEAEEAEEASFFV
jgi:hypothetical protein